MNKVLVVEDSLTVRKILSKLLEDNPYLTPILCKDFAEATQELERGSDFLAAIVDLNLPDAPNGESVELSLSYSIPTLVLTGNFDEFTRAQLLDLGVLDYVTKESRYSYNQVIKLIDRLRKNLTTKVLVVEDSVTSRNYICSLLKKFQFQIYEAKRRTSFSTASSFARPFFRPGPRRPSRCRSAATCRRCRTARRAH